MQQPRNEFASEAATSEANKSFNPNLEKGTNVMNNSTMLQNCNSLVSIVDGQAVTTSEIVAEKSENQHKNVLELIRTYLTDLEEFGQVAFQTRAGYNNAQVTIALLNEQQVTLLFTYMRNTDVIRKFKKDLVKAFFYLAQKARDPMEFLNDPASMRLLLGNYAEKVIALEGQIQEVKPKVEAFERISDAQGSLCLRDAAKSLQIQPVKFNQLLQELKWIYRRQGNKNFLGYQDKVQSGFITHKITTITDLGTGEDKICEQVRITPKGLAKLAQLLTNQVA